MFKHFNHHLLNLQRSNCHHKRLQVSAHVPKRCQHAGSFQESWLSGCLSIPDPRHLSLSINIVCAALRHLGEFERFHRDSGFASNVQCEVLGCVHVCAFAFPHISTVRIQQVQHSSARLINLKSLIGIQRLYTNDWIQLFNVIYYSNWNQKSLIFPSRKWLDPHSTHSFPSPNRSRRIMPWSRQSSHVSSTRSSQSSLPGGPQGHAENDGLFFLWQLGGFQ